MRQRKKKFQRILSVVLSVALTVTSGAFGAFQTNSTIAEAADAGVSVPGTDWKLYAGDIAVDAAGVQYKWKSGNTNEVQVVGVTSSFSSSEYEIPSSIPVTYAMYQELYLNSGPAASGETKVTEIADNAFDGNVFGGVASLQKVKISEGIALIGKEAFMNSSITELEIPDSVTDVGRSTESGIYRGPESILSNTSNCTIYCGKDSAADKYFQLFAKSYPDVKIEYLPDAVPTASPSATPGTTPTASPSASPAVPPSAEPTANPSATPAASPSVTPGTTPTVSPSATPDTSPAASPSATSGTTPTASPSAVPSVQPTANTPAGPGVRPSRYPIVVPSATPAPVFTPVPAASTSPDSSAGPAVTSVPEPSYHPVVTTDPDATATPPVVIPAPTDDIFTESYEIDQNKNSVVVTDMTAVKTSNVKIPATVTVDGKKYPVTEIRKNAFAGNKNVKTVTLGKNIKTIGAGAFKGCMNLTSVKFPSGLDTIGKNSFSDCKKLKKVSLPNSTKKIGTAAFKNCKALEQFVVGKKLKQKKGALSAGGQQICYGASSVKLDISASAFENCVSLREMVINSLVRRIGNSALKNCKSLRSLIVNSEILKEVAKRALKGVHDCKISVPGIKLKPYSVLFKNKGQGKKVIVAKI